MPRKIYRDPVRKKKRRNAFSGIQRKPPVSAENLKRPRLESREHSALYDRRTTDEKYHTLLYPKKRTVICFFTEQKGHDFNKDKWIGVGGKFEDKESPEECLLREVKEETGLDLISWRWHGIVTFVSDEYPTEYMYLYTSSDYTGSLIDCDEGELEWVPKSRIFELPIWPGDRIFLHLMQTGIPFFSLKLVYRKDRLIAVKLNHRELSSEEIGSLISSPI